QLAQGLQGTRHLDLRVTIRAHRVQRDAQGALPQISSTSKTCSPLYVPHVGHTRCGSFGSPHFGQRCAEGISAFIAPRRLRLRCFETRFFGTAIVLVLSVYSEPSRRSAAQRSSSSDTTHSHGASFRSAPHVGQSPLHSSRHKTCAGAASTRCSRSAGPRSSVQPVSGSG